MKKNKMMRAASALLVAVLLTTCAISGTFAKYTTSTTGTDKARVAYWGFEQDASIAIDELFAGTYDHVNSKGEVDGFSDVVAPGTTKSTTFAFNYKPYKTDKITAPEVAYTFKVDVAVEGKHDALDANRNFVWTLQKGSAAAVEYQTVDELVAALKALSGDATGTKTYNPGELPEAFNTDNAVYTIGWNWDFNENGPDAQDVTDTAMGNADVLDNVTFDISISATQMD